MSGHRNRAAHRKADRFEKLRVGPAGSWIRQLGHASRVYSESSRGTYESKHGLAYDAAFEPSHPPWHPVVTDTAYTGSAFRTVVCSPQCVFFRSMRAVLLVKYSRASAPGPPVWCLAVNRAWISQESSKDLPSQTTKRAPQPSTDSSRSPLPFLPSPSSLRPFRCHRSRRTQPSRHSLSRPYRRSQLATPQTDSASAGWMSRPWYQP